MRFFRRRDRGLRPLGEAEAYARVHGERNEKIKIVHLPPRRKRYSLRVSGETLRRGLEQRLDAREPEEAEVEAAGLEPEPGPGPAPEQPALEDELTGLLEAEVARRDDSAGPA